MKEDMNIVIVGHVDHGKSTLMGRLRGYRFAARGEAGAGEGDLPTQLEAI